MRHHGREAEGPAGGVPAHGSAPSLIPGGLGGVTHPLGSSLYL